MFVVEGWSVIGMATSIPTGNRILITSKRAESSLFAG